MGGSVAECIICWGGCGMINKPLRLQLKVFQYKTSGLEENLCKGPQEP